MATDRLKYFRIETREILEGLGQGVMALEAGGGDPALVKTMLRHAHTLKGAARVVGQNRIATLAHEIEDVLLPLCEASTQQSPELIQELLTMLDAISGELMEQAAIIVPAAPGPPPSVPSPHGEEAIETVRIELDAIDTLLADLSFVAAQLEALRQQASSLDTMRQQLGNFQEQLQGAPAGKAVSCLETLREAFDRYQQEATALLEQAGRGVEEVLYEVNHLRLLPAKMIFSHLERAARDTAVKLGKQVVFEAQGGEHRIDRHVLLPLRDALVHAVSNAVDHGLESAAERSASGKPAAGHLGLQVERHGAFFRFHLQDDGRGIDLKALRQAAIKHGVIDELSALQLDPTQTLDLVFLDRVTTVDSATAVSGRGIGMSALRSAVEKLHGGISLDNHPGKGLGIDFHVPVSLSSLKVLQLQVKGNTYLLPLAAVETTLRVKPEDLMTSPQGLHVIHEGCLVPFVRLQSLLERSDSDGSTGWMVALVRSGGERIALGADALNGTIDVIVRPLPSSLAHLKMLGGSSMDAGGTPLPLLDPAGIVGAARERPTPLRREELARPLPILVIDDSLTTRMLEQSILESAGLEVELASSGEEGLEKARRGRHSLFLVDVEMPGMSGFDFVRLSREDPDLKEVPAILVTSLSAADDRRRGLEVGAKAYIVKGEFDQGQFLRTVRSLMRSHEALVQQKDEA